MSYTFSSNVSIETYDALLDQHPQSNILQQSAWATVKEGWVNHRCGVFEHGVLIAGALLLVRTLPLGIAVGYIPRGPWMDYQNKSLCAFMLSELRNLASKLNLVSIKFDPNVHQTFGIGEKDLAQQAKFDSIVAMLEACGALHQGYSLDMYATTQPRFQLGYHYHGDVLAEFPKKTREKVKSTLGYHIEIEEKDISHVEEFYQMIAYTEKRKGIVLRNSHYFKTMMEAFGDHATFLFSYINHKLLIEELEQRLADFLLELGRLGEQATKKKEILAVRIKKVSRELEVAKADQSQDGDRVLISALLLVRDSTSTELLYSGLNEHYRQYLAPYALRYHALLWGQQQGCSKFNFGGVQGSLDDGLFEFKSAFHPSIDVYIGEFDLVLRPVLYRLMEQGIPRLKQWKLKVAKRGKTI